MTMIDLDRPDAEPQAQRAGARSRLALTALALVVAGGVIGGVAVDRWRAQRQLDANRSAASVVLLPDPLQRPDDATTVDTLTGPAVLQVELAAHVDVVNAGPAPVRFVSLRADREGLLLRGGGAAGAVAIAPGDFAVGVVHATVTCAKRPAGAPVPAVVEVESADGVLRRPTVTVEWRAWADQIAEACDGPVPGSWSRRR
jgi:hypothetical protein